MDSGHILEGIKLPMNYTFNANASEVCNWFRNVMNIVIIFCPV